METQQTEENAPPSLINHAIKYGVILGGISIILTIILYVVDFSLMAGFKFLGLMIVVGLGMVIYAGINYRNEIGGFMPYGKAFMHGFVMLAISGLISTIFNITLYTVVDPELSQKMTDVIIQNTEEMMAGFGAPQSTIDQTTEGMRIEMPEQFTVGGFMIQYLKALIFYCIIAVITSLFVRKNVPVEM
jgi:Protein of unknown function (DUF4199)